MTRPASLTPRFAIAAALLFALGVTACESAERRETAVLAQAVERFHIADNTQKPAAVTALRAVPCTAPAVCRARDACLAAAEPTAKALKLKSEVEQGLSALEKGQLPKDSPEAHALAQKLDDAEGLLKEGFKALPACDDQVADLKHKNRL
jgi:hypothetical protein